MKKWRPIILLSRSWLALALVLSTFFGVSQHAYAAPFSCEPGFFQSMNSGQLKKLNTSTETYDTIGNSGARLLNAIGYNILDDYIYGINNFGGSTDDELVRINSDGTANILGTPTGLTAGNYVAGDMDESGNLYTTDSDKLWVIDVSANTASSMTLSGVANLSNINDFVYISGYLYATNGINLYQVDVSDASVVTKTITGGGLDPGNDPRVYGAGWTSAGGKLYFSQNTNGTIYEITGYTTGSPSGSEKYSGQSGLSGNDGAACPQASSVIVPINAVDDSTSTTKNTTKELDATHGLLKNDSPDNATVQSYTQPLHGTITVQPDGSYTYVPETGFVGTDTFTYTIVNSVDETDTATVTITVTDETATSVDSSALASTGVSQAKYQLFAAILVLQMALIFALKRKNHTVH